MVLATRSCPLVCYDHDWGLIGMQATAGDISKIHRKLAKCVSERLGFEVSARYLAGYERWRKIQVRPVFFALFNDHHPAWVPRGPSRSSYCPIVTAVADYEVAYEKPVPWFAWSDKWQPTDDGFSLLAAGWSLYWGSYGRESFKQLLIRAEWDNLCELSNNAAQPHWHFHVPALVSNVDSDAPVEAGALDFSRMHLGMAGWRNSTDFPTCWQMETDGLSPTDLVNWADRVLACILCELGKVGAM